jgi:hypothetical protein
VRLIRHVDARLVELTGSANLLNISDGGDVLRWLNHNDLRRRNRCRLRK